MKRMLLVLCLGLLGSPSCSKPEGEACTGADCASPDGGKGADMRPAGQPACTEPRGTAYATVVSRFLMPTVAEPCAIDIDGDGNPDNALRLVVAGLRAVQFSLQETADELVKAGQLVQLLTLQTEDTKASTCAGVSLQRGLPAEAPPRFDGSDAFKVNQNLPATRVLGTLVTGKLATPAPMEQSAEKVARAELSLPAGFGVEVPLPIWGAHISGTSSDKGLVRGELHGVVSYKDVQGRMIPAIAQVLTAYVRKMPGSVQAQSIIATFETRAKCDAMPDLCCAKNPTKCEITADEVRNNAQTQALLRPDVQMFAGDRWAPNPLAEKPDSLSVGLCFELTPAKL
jgi:hypothetical protein